MKTEELIKLMETVIGGMVWFTTDDDNNYGYYTCVSCGGEINAEDATFEDEVKKPVLDSPIQMLELELNHHPTADPEHVAEAKAKPYHSSFNGHAPDCALRESVKELAQIVRTSG